MENMRQLKNSGPKRHWPHRIMAWLFMTLLFGLAQNAWAVQKGKVFIINKSTYKIEILIKKRSKLGLSYWKPLSTVTKGRTRIFNGIPSGTTLGFRSPDKKKKWPSRKFVFSKGKNEQKWTLR